MTELAKKTMAEETACLVKHENSDIRIATADILCFYLKECEIDIPEDKKFFVNVNTSDAMLVAIDERIKKLNIIEMPGETVRAFDGYFDYGHTSADWESVVSLGIFGLRQRVLQYAEKNDDLSKQVFYEQLIRVYDATLEFMLRAAKKAETCGKYEMAESLVKLTKRTPQTLFEVMQTTTIYYVLQEYMEHACLRTLGRVDSLYFDFYQKETDKDYARELVRDFYKEIDGWNVGANIPIAIGADAKRNAPSNELTKIFLEEYRKLNLTSTKLHLLCCPDTPKDILEEALAAVREGKNSIMFMSNEKIMESLKGLGVAEADARNYQVVGCYESGGREELTCSCSTRINLPKAVEYAMTGGVDLMTDRKIGLENDGNFADFDEFFAEYLRQVRFFADGAFEVTEKYERDFSKLFAAPFLSSTYASALKKGGDIYADYGAKYNNTSINALGLATATDSLAAIKKLVFENQTLTLSELSEILRTDWAGHEPLRQTIKNRFPKYGTNESTTNEIAANTVKALGEYVNGRNNKRGGVWRLGLFSVDWRWLFGSHTAASADSRHAGEPLSQNTGASFGMDREGATAHMLSICALDNTLVPNGSVLDLDIHISATEGDSGLNALVSGLQTFFALGGFGVHYNILDAETLKKAKICPEDYPNLQVRLCGWNVLFSTLSDREKDEFIMRFENRA